MFGYPWFNSSPVRGLWDFEVSRQWCWVCVSPTGMGLWWSHQHVIAVSCGFEDFKLGCVGPVESSLLQRLSLMCLCERSCSLVRQSEGFSLDLDWWYQASHKETPLTQWTLIPNADLTFLTRMSIPARSTVDLAGCCIKVSLCSSGPLFTKDSQEKKTHN